VIEPVPTSALDSFFGVSVLFFAYIGLSVTISVGLASLFSATGISPVLIFVAVAVFLFAPFWSLVKKHYPDPPEH